MTATAQRDYHSLQDDALLAIPLPGSEEEASEEAEDWVLAIHHVPRRLMLDSHGCTGRGCTSDRHEADREAMHEVLYALEFWDDPYAGGGHRDHWGRRVKPPKVKPGQP